MSFMLTHTRAHTHTRTHTHYISQLVNIHVHRPLEGKATKE